MTKTSDLMYLIASGGVEDDFDGIDYITASTLISKYEVRECKKCTALIANDLAYGRKASKVGKDICEECEFDYVFKYMTPDERARWHEAQVAKSVLADKEHNEAAKEYRRCETCNVFITEGFVVGSGALYYCNYHPPVWWEELTAKNPDGDDENYWTEWDYGFPEGHDATCHLENNNA